MLANLAAPHPLLVDVRGVIDFVRGDAVLLRQVGGDLGLELGVVLRAQLHLVNGVALTVQADKYATVGKVTVRNHLAYVYDLLVRSLFLLVILYVFVQLWSVTFEGTGLSVIAGYRYEQIIWYLIFAEAIIMAVPKLTAKVEEEVKRGDHPAEPRTRRCQALGPPRHAKRSPRC